MRIIPIRSQAQPVCCSAGCSRRDSVSISLAWRVHFPQLVPRPVCCDSSRKLQQPRSAASRIVLSLTAWHTQIYMPES